MEGGPKVEYTDYILDLWKRIGYSNNTIELEGARDTDTENYVPQQTGGSFTPLKGSPPDTDKYNGVSINSFQRILTMV